MGCWTNPNQHCLSWDGPRGLCYLPSEYDSSAASRVLLLAVGKGPLVTRIYQKY